jgi:hypothetical protein
MALKQLATILILAAALMAMSACGSGNSASQNNGAPLSLTPGNWLFIENSTAHPDFPAPSYFRGPLQTSSDSVTANFNVSGNACFPAPISLSGDTSSGVLNLTSAPDNNQVMTITATLNPGSNFDGTYSKPGGGPPSCSNDTGTVYGTYVPPIDGNWSGSLARVIGGPIGVTASIQQGSVASPANNFPLSGTLALSNDSCFTSGTIDSTQSYVMGEQVLIVANSATSSVTLTAYLVNPTKSTVIQVTDYSVVGCNGDYGTGTLNIT